MIRIEAEDLENAIYHEIKKAKPDDFAFRIKYMCICIVVSSRREAAQSLLQIPLK
ncbi:hypothetical protein DI53_3144 [Sphingobacterium deserti]|uniref:Uncharacterized protein n=1 Tax=Sphingobacterium deserti TaxID=1229276 RepID=A0A0B8T6T1_9SPHI|nr:hypothetical protein DI53_3144 [Sphingobacterium deserti]